MSNQYPGPGQPGELPPTQVAPGGVPPQQPPAPQQPYGAPPPQQPYGAPQQPYGAPPPPPGGGYPGGGYPAPPTGGGGGRRVGLILGIVAAVVALIVIAAVVLLVVLGGDDKSNDAKDKVTLTTTLPTAPSTDLTTPTDVTTAPSTDLTTDTSSGTSGFPTEDPSITAEAYLNSVLESNCLAVEGLSTPEWFQQAYGSQKACKKNGGGQDMSTAVYEPFAAPVDNGDGSVTLTTTVTDSSDTSGTKYTGTWILVPTDDGTTWLVNGFELN